MQNMNRGRGANPRVTPPNRNADTRPDGTRTSAQGRGRAQDPRTAPPRKKKRGCGTRVAAVLVVALLIVAVVYIVHGRRAKDAETAPETAAPAVTAADTAAPPKDDGKPSAWVDAAPLAPYSDSSTASLDPAIDCPHAVMIERANGHIVCARRADARVYPASLTKVMSLIVAVENCTSLDDTITFTGAMIDPYYRQNASLAGFAVGETVTLRDMLYGMILPSGADAADGVVRITAGDDEHFVALMNEKCDELGLKNTHFTNAVGLYDPHNYSTCNELAIILDYALQNADCRAILSTYKYTTAATEQHPDGIELTSDLQSRMEGGESGVARIYGGKTGYVTEAKHCLACFAQANGDGREYVIVLCGGDTKWKPVFDSINICKKYIGGLEIE